MKLKVTAIVERNSDGKYSCHVSENLGNYGIAGYGDTAEEAKNDMLECYEEMKELNAEDGIETPEFEISYRYDMQAFFNKFSFINISAIAEKAGMNASLLRRYANGRSVASEKQKQRIWDTVKDIREELALLDI